VFANIAKVLAAHGATFADIVNVSRQIDPALLIEVERSLSSERHRYSKAGA
jgi:hypothetical protein